MIVKGRHVSTRSSFSPEENDQENQLIREQFRNESVAYTDLMSKDPDVTVPYELVWDEEDVES